MIYVYGIASREWHQFMEVGNEETDKFLGNETPAIFVSMANISSMIEEAVMRALTAMMTPTVTAEDVSTMIEQTITRILDGRPRSPLQPLEINFQSSTQLIVSKISPAKLLSTPRSFQKDENARFKSKEQRQAVEAVLTWQKDILVILLMGRGKTLLYLLLTLMEKGQTTVVVIPMIAVMQDLID